MKQLLLAVIFLSLIHNAYSQINLGISLSKFNLKIESDSLDKLYNAMTPKEQAAYDKSVRKFSTFKEEYKNKIFVSNMNDLIGRDEEDPNSPLVIKRDYLNPDTLDIYRNTISIYLGRSQIAPNRNDHQELYCRLLVTMGDIQETIDIGKKDFNAIYKNSEYDYPFYTYHFNVSHERFVTSINKHLFQFLNRQRRENKELSTLKVKFLVSNYEGFAKKENTVSLTKETYYESKNYVINYSEAENKDGFVRPYFFWCYDYGNGDVGFPEDKFMGYDESFNKEKILQELNAVRNAQGKYELVYFNIKDVDWKLTRKYNGLVVDRYLVTRFMDIAVKDGVKCLYIYYEYLYQEYVSGEFGKTLKGHNRDLWSEPLYLPLDDKALIDHYLRLHLKNDEYTAVMTSLYKQNLIN